MALGRGGQNNKSCQKTDWQFQFDNELPISLNKKIFIPKGVMHRIIKGIGDLQIKNKTYEKPTHF